MVRDGLVSYFCGGGGGNRLKVFFIVFQNFSKCRPRDKDLKVNCLGLARVTQLAECRPVHRRVACSIPGQAGHIIGLQV